MTITTKTLDAEIYYTTDGSSPLDPGTRCSDRPSVHGPDCHHHDHLPAPTAYKSGWVPTNIDTHTYIFPRDVITQATDPQTGAQVTPSGYPASWGSAPGDYQVDPDVVASDGKDKFGGLYAKTIQDDLKSVPTRVPGNAQG